MATMKQADRLRQAIEQAANSRHAMPLGNLWRSVQAHHGPATLGQFHDALRDLAARGTIRLEPYTGAMYALQDPECCLILGREIMAYVTR